MVFAMKCTSTICDGVEYPVAKEPKTDSGKEQKSTRSGKSNCGRQIC